MRARSCAMEEEDEDFNKNNKISFLQKKLSVGKNSMWLIERASNFQSDFNFIENEYFSIDGSNLEPITYTFLILYDQKACDFSKILKYLKIYEPNYKRKFDLELRIKAYIDPVTPEGNRGIFKFWLFDLSSNLDREFISVYYKTCIECIFIYNDLLESAHKALAKETIIDFENVYFVDIHEGIGDSTTSSNEEMIDQRTKSELSAFENYFCRIEENQKETKDENLE